MANLSLNRVNQKLNQAKVLCVDVEVDSLTSVEYQSILEASAFHLVCAYRHYLRELAEVYGVKIVGAIKTEEELVLAFETAKKYPVEVQELIALRSDHHSWLAQLNSYYDSLWLLPAQRGIDALEREELIVAVNIEPVFDISEVSIAVILGWQSAFSSLVIRQRQTSAEF